MPANVAMAMQALEKHKLLSLKDYSYSYKIGINSTGIMFEEYIKDLLTGRFYENEGERMKAMSQEFAWIGNQNFPPDAIAKGGDAFEIKKHEGKSGTIALNSSQPRDMLYSWDSKITSECRNSIGQQWDALDLFYVVGTVPNKNVKSIYFVQGKCYAASPDIYDSISSSLSKAVKNAIEVAGLEYSTTKELGRVNKADPLGRASLRIRGMWQIVDPSKAFSNIAQEQYGKEFFAYAIMEKKKFDSFKTDIGDVSVRDEQIPNPNNPAKLLDAIVMEVSW